MSYLVVSSLADLPVAVSSHGALDVVTLINADTVVDRPISIAADRHLFIGMNDIIEPMDGMILPGVEHIDQLLEFGRRWDRAKPLAVHCFAGISRSTAAAYILACAINPDLDEQALAEELRRRSPSATPNSLMVEIADAKLGRDGRMVRAIESIGRGEIAFSGTPFVLPLEL
ncbi:tyrosine phosphatase family protein [Mangrovibrevibacter kandeliae]|uniref:tyrosine phosphatase family protein n=1 Tax=Mangrovibrevibacter kandeliae TaxID=2968473 RepID=UPI00211885D6|nr:MULTISPECIES: tyrosine protein phosphatase [unclassified Aurantimonas]MCQ8781148.1 tyrosine protein phosphatase [Aurantimonas sp. CSK15Z-1]MCW4113926.1 tyrosine protein phosphatase [Aurantimonas sp. MSK8Z-1]